jgi:nucleoside-diphosphate-sugar epimerase
MTQKRIFVTGASGCIGHYVAEALIQETDHELFFLVRTPAKLKFDYQARPGIKLLEGDLYEIERHSELLKTVDVAILIATSWGGSQEVLDINVEKTVKLVNLLDPTLCQQVIYFSTASILDRTNQPLPQAGDIGTDYIRSKYLAYQALQQAPLASKLTVLFPTLVFGGNDRFPKSHLSSGLKDVVKWLNLVRFFQADGSFHFIHARDIAQIVQHLVDHSPSSAESRQLVLGNTCLTINQTVEQLCEYFRQPIYFRIPLYLWLADLFIFLFRVQVGDWERFSLHYRHFTHQNVVNPLSFGLQPYAPRLSDVFRVSGITPAEG